MVYVTIHVFPEFDMAVTNGRWPRHNDRTRCEFRFGSFDHLVSLGEHQHRDLKAEGVSGLEIDHHFYLGALLDWEVSRLGALENFPT